MDFNNLDKEFIAKAQRQFVFDIPSTAWTSTKYKKEIQYLLGTNIFPKFNLSKTIKGTPRSAEQINKLIVELKSYGKEAFEKIYKYPTNSGYGPGEVILYFLLNDCTLGGGSSAGVDVNVGTKKYEVKSVLNPAMDNYSYVKGFKIGGTLNTATMVSDALAIKEAAIKEGAIKLNNEKSGVSSTQIKDLKNNKKYHKEWHDKVEVPFQKAAGAYLSSHPVIFMINTSPKEKIGEVVYFGNINPANVTVDVVTAGIIKPMVKIK